MVGVSGDGLSGFAQAVPGWHRAARPDREERRFEQGCDRLAVQPGHVDPDVAGAGGWGCWRGPFRGTAFERAAG